jgi:hypothetical protein
VGFACANLAIAPLESLLEQPECPNLYWALTDLPDPFISIKTAVGGERFIVGSIFHDLSETAPMSGQQISEFIKPLDRFVESENAKKPHAVRDYVATHAKNPEKVGAARKRLVDGGLSERTLESFPPEQVILLDQARECRARFDEIARIMSFPAWQFEALYDERNGGKIGQPTFADEILPTVALVSGRRAHARFEQRIALLRHVEALRMYAAEHNGAFPAALADVSVPLPVDPFTGKPFGYEQKAGTAHLRGTPPQAEKNIAAFRVHYEITLRN